jgi:hypothetical protein
MLCRGTLLRGELPTPPVGQVSFIEARLNSDCKVELSAVQLLSSSRATTPTASLYSTVVQQIASLPRSSSLSGPFRLAGTTSVSSGDQPSRTVGVHQREWDCCGILMTEADTYAYYTWNGSAVTGYNAYNTASYHRENCPGCGWYVNDQWIHVIGGCAGCWNIDVQGHLSFGYKGIFDPGGGTYNNSYDDFLHVYGDGGWTCTYAFYPRNTAPGWHAQQWCG